MVKSIIMASTVVFDMADPGVKSMIDGWADNTEYEVTLKVRTGAGPTRNVAEVTNIDQDEAGEMEDGEAEVPAAETQSKPKPIAYSKKME